MPEAGRLPALPTVRAGHPLARWATAGALLAFALAGAGNALAQVSVADELRSACERIQSAASVDDVKAIQNAQTERFSQRRERFRREVAVQYQRVDSALVALDQAAAEEKTISGLSADLMDVARSRAIEEELRQARMEVARVELKELARNTVQKAHDETLAQSGYQTLEAAERRQRLKADMDKLDGEIRLEKPAALRRRDAADKAVSDRETAVRDIRPKLDAAREKLAAAKLALEKAKLGSDSLAREPQAVADALNGLTACADRRRSELASSAPRERPVEPAPIDESDAVWTAIAETDNATLLEAFLAEYPNSRHAGAARARLVALKRGT